MTPTKQVSWLLTTHKGNKEVVCRSTSEWLYFDSYLKTCQQIYSLIVIPFLMRITSKNIFYEPQITVSKSDSNLIPSEKSYRLQITVRLRKFPIYETIGSEERITREVTDIIPLKINVCKLIFGQENSQLPMDLSNTDLRWKSTYNIAFFKNIYKQDIEHLSRWANNRTLSIGLETTGVAIVDESLLEFQLGLRDGQFKLGPDEFDSIFLKNTGLQYIYMRTFELSSPLIDNLSSKPSMYELYDYICNLQNNLEHALRILRHSGDPLEVLALIRQPLDSIKVLRNKPIIDDIAKELYVSTKIFVDLGTSVGGADKAAKEIVEKLFTIFEILFDISSKAAHTKTKNQSQMYKMTPQYDEAEFSLTLALIITNYLISRIKFSCL